MRRKITRIVLLLCAGAVISIAVAWSCAVWIDAFPPRPELQRHGISDSSEPYWNIIMVRRFGSTYVHFYTAWRLPPAPPPLDATALEIHQWVQDMELHRQGGRVPRRDNAPVLAGPAWSRATLPPTDEQYRGPGVGFSEDARGWPLRCMVSFADTATSPAGKAMTSVGPTHRFELGGVQGPLGLPRGLPMRPMALGLAGNTVFYAMLIGIAFAGFFHARRFLRRRRQCCEVCGYPLGQSDICTECGAALISQSGRPASPRSGAAE